MERLKQHILENLWKEFEDEEDFSYERGWFDAHMKMLGFINQQLGLPLMDGVEESRVKYIQSKENKNVTNTL